MSEKHYIKNSGGNWREINPTLFAIKYSWKKDDNIKSWYKQMTADIVLKGLDFDFIKQYETSSNECKVLDYKIVRDNVTEFEGYLDLRGEYLPGKTFKSKIIDIEKIECLFRDEEINLFDYATDRYSCRPYYGSLEFAEYTISYTASGTSHIGTKQDISNCWKLINETYTKGLRASDGTEFKAYYYKWVREIYHGSIGFPPPGDGWKEVYPGTFARPVSTTKNEDVENEIHPPNGGYYIDYIQSWSYLPPFTLTNGIKLSDVLFHIFDECGYTFKSEFFRDSVTVSNEVYDTVNALFKNILIYHISDVIYVEEEGNATKMLCEKGKFISEIINYFNLELWRNSGNVYLEHKSYKTRELNLDISSSKYYNPGYKYKSDIAKSEEWLHTEGSRNENFKDIKLEYGKNCVREISRSELSESFSILFADLASVISNKTLWENNDIDKATIVMVSVADNGVINRSDSLFESGLMNGCLSFAYLINHLYNYDRKEKSGYVKDFKILNNLTGSGKENSIKFPMTIANFNYKTPYNYLKTDDGTAIINSLDFENNYCTINYEFI